MVLLLLCSDKVLIHVRFDVLTALNIKIKVFWDVNHLGQQTGTNV
jgi:hypothetical protein